MPCISAKVWEQKVTISSHSVATLSVRVNYLVVASVPRKLPAVFLELFLTPDFPLYLCCKAELLSP
jgi:hypothetical protein